MSPLTRLRVGLLRIASCWTVHFAHKPLCSRFRGEVIELGALVLCRSCTCVHAGIVVTALILAATAGGDVSLPLYGAATAAGLLFSFPGIYKRWPRPVRDLLRFLSGGLIAAGVALLFGPNPLAGASGLLLLLLFWRFYLVRRRARLAHVCDGCPDLVAGTVCPGFERQAACLRDWEEKAAALLTSERLRGRS